MEPKIKPTTTAIGKLASGWTKGAALERPPLGAFVGGSPRTEPDEGTVEVGVVVGAPPASEGPGAGENDVYVGTESGGAISGGNCWIPASILVIQWNKLRNFNQKNKKKR